MQLLRVLLSGAFDRFPNLQVISGHWGRMAPFYLQRLDDMIPGQISELSRTISETFKQHVYVTPSGMMYLPHFEFIRKVLGEDRILYSVDYSHLTLAGARRFLETLPTRQGEK
ncbi:amidohydrolase family protein [Acidisarcina polymorpha]|uniref:amidohydrolase family protein n=1 Tax=Acidisarcina polymorpha TaxID=2211140 RepID=UPI0039C8AB8D